MKKPSKAGSKKAKPASTSNPWPSKKPEPTQAWKDTLGKMTPEQRARIAASIPSPRDSTPKPSNTTYNQEVLKYTRESLYPTKARPAPKKIKF